MTAPKIDTQAPERIWAHGRCMGNLGQPPNHFASTYHGTWETRVGDANHASEYILASLSAAREVAAVERAFRDGLAYATNCRVKDHDQAWQQSWARARLGDTSALDRLIAERVREALIEVRDLIAERRNAQEPGPIFGAYNEAMGDVEDVRCRRARGSKEGRDG